MDVVRRCSLLFAVVDVLALSMLLLLLLDVCSLWLLVVSAAAVDVVVR